MLMAMKTFAVAPLVIALSAVGFARTAHASEHTVACTTLPSAVQEKGKSMLDGGTMHACVKDVSKGVTTYEIEMLKNGRSRDVTFDAAGNVLEIEEQVDMDSLPAPVKAAIDKQAEGGKAGKVESLTKAGVLVSYETTITKGGKRREVAFHPDGTSMKAD